MPYADAIDAIPIVDDATEREANFPVGSRAIDQRVFRKDTLTVERWSGSAWTVDLTQSFTHDLGGSIPRTVTDKLTDFATDKDFGVVADLSVDDSAAMTLAAQAASDNVTRVNLVAGYRKILSSIVVTTAQYMHLVGTGFSTLYWLGAANATLLKLTGAFRRTFLDGLWLKANDATVTLLEMNTPGALSNCGVISRNIFEGPNAQAVLVNSEYDDVIWLANVFNTCGKGVYFKKSSGVHIPSSNHTFLGNRFSDCTDWAVDSEDSGNHVLIGNSVQQNTAKGFRFNQQTTLTYLGQYIEQPDVEGATGLTINATTGHDLPGGAYMVGGSTFVMLEPGSVGMEIGAVGTGAWIGPNFWSVPTAIRLLPNAPQEITIEPQGFDTKVVTTQIDDQRVNPSRAYQFNIGAKMEMPGPGFDPFLEVVSDGALMRTVYKVKIPKTAWRGLTPAQDIRIATTKPRSRICAVYCDTTVAYAGLSGSLDLRVVTAAGGQLILPHDPKVISTRGLSDADLGSSLARASAVQGAAGSWAGDDIVVRLTHSGGNLGNGAVTNLTTGETFVYVVTEVMP